MKAAFALVFVVISLIAFYSCNDLPRNQSYAHVPPSNIKKGHALAQQYCGSCHLLPDPSLLSATTWEKDVLPNMGPYLGIFQHNAKSYPIANFYMNLSGNFYPSRPLLDEQQWQCIIDYYTATAPDSLPDQEREQRLQVELAQFEVHIPAIKNNAPAVSFIKMDAISNNGFFFYDLTAKSLYKYNSDLQPEDSVIIQGSVVDAMVHNGRWLTCNIGNINPADTKLGALQYLDTCNNGKLKPVSGALLRDLARPVSFTPADLNEDGRVDYVVCEFGYVTGSLSWYEQTSSGAFEQQVIRALPGATKAYVQDYNKDSLPDLWVLFAQGEEGIFLLTNKGGGRFQEEQVVRFPPSYGSTFFELVDMNEDGFQDIVYTCGDNADYTRILKPYHGIYVLINDGKNGFETKYFYPVNGCFKALARDFDNDGDLDIAAISFFADYVRQPEEGFVYLENKGDLRFQPYTFPESRLGRWLTMDAGDVDGDGNIDLLLGNFSTLPSFLPSSINWKAGPDFIFLKNNGRKKSGDKTPLGNKEL